MNSVYLKIHVITNQPAPEFRFHLSLPTEDGRDSLTFISLKKKESMANSKRNFHVFIRVTSSSATKNNEMYNLQVNQCQEYDGGEMIKY